MNEVVAPKKFKNEIWLESKPETEESDDIGQYVKSYDNDKPQKEKKKKKKKDKKAISNEHVAESDTELDSIKSEKQTPPSSLASSSPKKQNIFSPPHTSQTPAITIAKPKKKSKKPFSPEEHRPNDGDNDSVSSKRSAKESDSNSSATPSKKRKMDENTKINNIFKSPPSKNYESSSHSTPSKKQKKEAAKNKAAALEAEQPPPSVFEYFVENIYQGKKKKARKAFDNLPKKEKKKLKAEYKAKVDDYGKKLTSYLNSLPKEEAVKYVICVFFDYPFSTVNI